MQFETVEEIRKLEPGRAATLIPSWNTGLRLCAEPAPGTETQDVVRPGQKLVVLEVRECQLKVHAEATGAEGWLPRHVLTPWPD